MMKKIISVLIILKFVCGDSFAALPNFAEQFDRYKQKFYALENVNKTIQSKTPQNIDIPPQQQQKIQELVSTLASNVEKLNWEYFDKEFKRYFNSEDDTAKLQLTTLLMLANLDEPHKFISELKSYLLNPNNIALDNPDFSLFCLKHSITKTSASISEKIVNLCRNINFSPDVITLIERLLKFSNKHQKIFDDVFKNDNIADELKKQFNEADFATNNLSLKALLLIEDLVDFFPAPQSDSSTLEILLGLKDGEVTQFQSQPFNASYKSMSIFPVFSKRVIYLIKQLLFEKSTDLNNLVEIFLWTGLARAVIDLFDGRTITSFGKLLNGNPLFEPWNLYSLRDRILAITSFTANDKLPYNQIMTLSKDGVYHFPVNPALGFLSHFNKALSSEPWKDDLLKFILHFSISSTFARGQGAIMEWFYTALRT